MANKTFLVAQREYLENVRTKTFWIGILALPVLIAISFGAGFVLNKLKQTQSYAVLDTSDDAIGPRIERTARSADMEALARMLAGDTSVSGPLATLQRDLGDDLGKLAGSDPKEPKALPEGMAEKMQDWLQQLPAADLEEVLKQGQVLKTAQKYRYRQLIDLGIDPADPAAAETRLNELVQKGDLFAYFVIGKAPKESLEDFRYVSNNFTDSDLRTWYGNAATKVVQNLRIADAGIERSVAAKIKEEVRFREKKIGESGATEDVKGEDKASGIAPVAFVYFLWIAIFTAAQMLLTNTVEEKSNRIIEVLLSSVSPLQLMAGKIWGIAATGLTITVSWALFALLGVLAAEMWFTGLDLSWAAAARDPLYLASFIAYFFFGYLLYAAILVGLGSVTNSLKEAQNLLQPVFVLLFVPLVSMVFIMQEPNGLVAKVLSYIPLFTPFVMMNRAGGPPEVYEYVITSVLLLATVWFAFKAAGKIFRVGILMTGNPPKLKEILSWLKEK